MNLFPIWSGQITIPALPMQREKVGGNFVYHSAFKDLNAKAEISESNHKNHYVLSTNLEFPFDRFYVRKPRSRKLDLDKSILTFDGSEAIQDWNENVKLKWDNSEKLLEFLSAPDNLVSSWQNKFRFKVADENQEIFGLRKPQIGALHAIAAHFSVGEKFEAASIVLPTGTGKTETMLSSLIYNRPQKLLVVVPSDALRSQIGNKFIGLGILEKLGCISGTTIAPRVAILKKAPSSAKEIDQLLAKSNVLVTLPNTLRTVDEKLLNQLCGKCSDLYVDEAHHLSANTWNKIKSKFLDKRIVQFTATPFRQDRKHIGGKIIFNYKLSDAQKDGSDRYV